MQKQRGVLQTIRSGLLPGAHIIFVVPALESGLLVGQVFSASTAVAFQSSSDLDIVHGRLPRDGVLTQHYLKEQIEMLLAGAGFVVHSVRKLEYSWDHEAIVSAAALLHFFHLAGRYTVYLYPATASLDVDLHLKRAVTRKRVLWGRGFPFPCCGSTYCGSFVVHPPIHTHRERQTKQRPCHPILHCPGTG